VPVRRRVPAITGKGVAAGGGHEYHMGGPALLKAEGRAGPDALGEAAEAAAGRGQAAIYLLADGEALAVFAVADAIREESREAIDAPCTSAGIEVAMLTGDAQAVADAVAEELGIDTVFAEVLPEDKASKVAELQAQGKRVAMVGDGVNDAPALATADIGIAIGAGTDVAVEAGHIVLVRSDPRDIPRIVSLSRATYRKMVQNLWWAAGYNIVAIPLAAGVLAAWGILLTPAVGAVLMSASTVIVAINAQLLRAAGSRVSGRSRCRSSGVASAVRSPTSASTSPLAQASTKPSSTRPASASAAANRGAPIATRSRARWASCLHATSLFPTTSATSG
jgi:P-type Cu2+ transporter